MSNPLFIEVSSEQQEVTAGGITINFGATNFFGSIGITTTTTTSLPDGGSETISETDNTTVETSGIVFAGFDLTEDLFSTLF
ncbi:MULTISPECIES: CTB family bacteriocin [unclassified Nodularia (in: cyanobacteria)]|uniref:CTB family bacteriocin n=1 Tax=unclassified Nodularia (in: cyanobacteria) TaxID=2656917 RepID=UPI00187F9970|nr:MULTISPECIES: CTB family bacteriocin [unclassified Nodularia (in: cyanobacteria)]MBE9200591.1 CTB family bacteriocin [Nodularia sp. LEGE 06071]MCC2692505.1 CTB family bacteriocin [Nodularia sp. LEGE 04288]